jgi:hypothetical protein
VNITIKNASCICLLILHCSTTNRAVWHSFYFYTACLIVYLLTSYKYAGRSACSDSLLTIVLPVLSEAYWIWLLYFFFIFPNWHVISNTTYFI